MKLYFLILLSFLLACQNVQGQDYRNLINAGVAFYSGSLAQPVYLSGVQADSVIAAGGGDTLIFAINTFRPMTPPGTFLDTVGGILGRRIEKLSTGWFRFFTATGDTILLNPAASLNDTWKFISLPQDGRLMATCTAIQPETFLGVNDTVKTFTFQAKDNTGGNLDHYFNGKSIKLSRLYGFTQVYDMFRMPESTSLYTLSGRSLPSIGFQGLTWHDIYDFNTGDIFEITLHENYMITAAHGERDHKYIKVVASKQISPGGETVTYTLNYCDEVTTNDPRFGTSTSNFSGTMTETYPYTHTPASYTGSLVPDIFNRDAVRDYAMMPGQMPGVPATGWKKGYYECCWKPDENYIHLADETEYGKGIGRVHFKKPASIPYPGYFDYADMVYYKKGTQFGGNPFNLNWCTLSTPLTVSPPVLTIGYHAGDTAIMHIATGDDWAITSQTGVTPFAFNPSNGSGNADVVVTALDSNVTGIPVSSTLVIAHAISVTGYQINQLSKYIPFLEIQPDTIVLSWASASYGWLYINTFQDWSLVSANWPSWAAAAMTSGTGNSAVRFTATEENDSIMPRFAEITLESPVQNKAIVIEQSGRAGAGTGTLSVASAAISPNPVRETARITVPGLPSGAKKTILLFDLMGRTVFSDHFRSTDYLFSRGKLAPGVYMMKVAGEGGSFLRVIKVIIE
jgi:hypothetical protein